MYHCSVCKEGINSALIGYLLDQENIGLEVGQLLAEPVSFDLFLLRVPAVSLFLRRHQGMSVYKKTPLVWCD
ncbi:hypothetical protein ACFL3F_02165 [Planctomycetota bacterium]